MHGYFKPNLSNLRGRNSKKIFETIRNTEPSDLSELKHRAEACKQEILTKRAEE